ncbi:MAG: hypothetical protein GFH25_541324n2 [Chloroflexi bacterium AL-N10]|nr:hypothetical protein [Chloroflexi bacterium AL-N10]
MRTQVFVRPLHLVLVLVFLLSWLPTAPVQAYPSAVSPASVMAQSEEPPLPEPLAVTPIEPRALPSLLLDVDVSPNPLPIGGTATFVVTVSNQSEHPAEEVVLTVPVPPAVRALKHTALRADEWHWELGRLDPQASTEVSATLLLTAAPTGDALLLRPEATARNLELPVATVGGALTVAENRAPVQVVVEAQRSATLISDDGRVEVLLPEQASDQPVTLALAPLEVATASRATTSAEPDQHGFEPFVLTATDEAGQQVESFAKDMTINLSYTPEQLAALGISEGDLTLFRYDEAAQTWLPLTTEVDRDALTATANASDVGTFALASDWMPSDAYIPSLQGFQVGLFTGSTSYNYPLELPAGPGGIRPELALSYNSGATDGEGGLRFNQQAGWSGRGWSLDTGSVARRKIRTDGATTVDYLVLTLNGQSFDLMRGPARVTAPEERQLWDWRWFPTNENFMRVQGISLGQSIPNQRGGTDQNGALETRYGWKIWTTDGTLYEFTEDLWWGFCAGNAKYTEPYRWLLRSVTDTQGNVITYNYARQSVSDWAEPDETCAPLKGTLDADAWPTEITWGRNKNVSGSVDRLRVSFRSEVRQDDTAYPTTSGQFRGRNAQPHETRRLLGWDVWSKPGSSWERMWGYNLTTDYSLYSDHSVCVSKCGQPDEVFGPNQPYRKLTLKAIQRYGKDGSTGLPKTTFAYQTDRGTKKRSLGGWNRLKTVDNGQGGIITLSYEHIAEAHNDNQFFNYHRLKTRGVSDGRGTTSTWHYRYGTPAMNTLGTRLGGKGPQEYPNSAVLYLNKNWDPTLNNQEFWLAHTPHKEFRGHAIVKETDPSGAETEYYYYQGDAACVPTATRTAMLSDSCFKTIRDREILKGQAHTVRRRSAPNGANMRETRHFFGIALYSYSYAGHEKVGLWRSFDYERETREYWYEGGSTPVVKTTVYEYRESAQSQNDKDQKAQFGNLTNIREYVGDSSGTLVRNTQRYYIARNTASTYIADRMWGETITDGTGKLLSLTHWLYDGATVAENPASLSRGNLTLERRYFNIPPTGCCANITLQGRDIRYGYDSYGNTTTESTYDGPGTHLNGTYSGPGNGSAARTTTTTYDSIFHVYPTKVVNPLGHTETAGYDWRMGTMTRVTDVNNQSTTAEYDNFGRLERVIKPGDSSASPTLSYYYGDTERPVRYFVRERDIHGQELRQGIRYIQRFYDGLGREIQTKVESDNWAQNIVVDRRFDGLGRTIAESQPRYVNETPSTTFSTYTAPGSSLYRPTTTTYDALDRPLKMTSPDGNWVEHHYGVQDGLLYDDVIDQNRHRTQSQTDALGRLRSVVELSGDCAPNYWLPTYQCTGATTTPWGSYATTRYDYDALDRLTKMTDAAGNSTTTTYDSAGRKTEMRDPDMGRWRYTYDANGNLKTQLDANNQTIWFAYDQLNRLTQKRASGSTGTVLATYKYDESHTSYGKGRRTSASTAAGANWWYYDARGRVVRADPTYGGGTRVFRWEYDSADRVTQITYPNNDKVNYTYDAAWRPKTMISDKVGTLVQSATYTAMDQPDRWTFGHNVAQDWDYDSMARVSKLAVSNRFDRRYSYDKVGNVTQIQDARPNAIPRQKYQYDHRDRLVRWEWGTNILGYAYTTTGNLTSRTGVGTYGYPSAGSARPHAPTTVGGQPYQYDANGNTLSGGGRTYTWTMENMPRTIKGTDGVTEVYEYDADGERVKKIRGNTTTIYVEGLWEEQINGTQTIIYEFNGRAIATRTGGSTALTYLHGDHLGSISLTSGAVESQQEFDPWGVVHQGGIDSSTTTLNYTGQRRDDTGLVYYHARYYDPRLGRFLSPDSIVPNPQDPQDLNRYTYAKNNPLRYTDPTGHCAIICTALVGAAIGGGISYGTQVAANISQNGLNVQALTNVDGGDIVAGAVAGGVAGATGFVATGAVGSVLSGTGVVSTMAAGSAVGVVSGQVERAVHNAATGQGVGNGLLNPVDMVTDATIGAVSGGFGHLTKRVAQVGAIKHDFDSSIMARHGVTNMDTGHIFISPKGSHMDRQFALNHERVHAFLTPKNARLRNARVHAYKKNALWFGAEETAAETFAHLRTGSGVRNSVRAGVQWGKSEYEVFRKYGGWK